MNRVILVLNVIVLVTNFVLAFAMSNSQIGLLDTTARVANRSAVVTPQAGSRPVSTAYLRSVQSLDSIAPATPERERSLEQYRALYEAVQAYYGVIDRSVASALFSGADPEVLRTSFEQMSRSARAAVERELQHSFPDDQLVRRLATEVIRNCP